MSNEAKKQLTYQVMKVLAPKSKSPFQIRRKLLGGGWVGMKTPSLKPGALVHPSANR